MIPFSVLDLAPITEGSGARESFRRSLDLAQHAERWGFERFWLAEHHNMPGVASAATAVVIGHIAAGTTTIRVGAGGIMLPNHAPLVIAEQFGTLAEIHGNRIDLGLGRAPGTDQVTMRALRRTLASDDDAFPQDVMELRALLGESRPGQAVHAVPGVGTNVPLWILGSSLFGAQLAAALGLPYAFASHFAPTHLLEAIEIYRARFRPSAQLAKPYVMVGMNVFAADTDDEANLLMTSLEQAFANLRRGRPTPLKPPRAGFGNELTASERVMLSQAFACSAVGSPATVKKQIESVMAQTKADEVIVTSQIFDHTARLRSFEITAQVRDELREGATGG